MPVSEFSFTVVGETRDKVAAEMDEVTLRFLDQVGGEPWLAIDDDIQRQAMVNGQLVSDQQFSYVGRKRMLFRGPMNMHNMEPLTNRDGFRPQIGNDEEGLGDGD